MAENIGLNTSTIICIPGIVLRSAFVAEKLSVMCLNVQSLCARNMVKFDELRQVMNMSNVDVTCVCETWLNGKIDTSVVDIPGYNTVRSDRIGKIGGGLLMYIKKCFKFKTIDTSYVVINDHTIEFMFIEVYIQNKRLLVGLFYNHPELDCSDILLEKLTDFGSQYDEILVLGDFNTNISKKNAKSDRLLETLNVLGLVNVGCEPTFFYAQGASQLDLVMTNNIDRILRFGQVSVPNISHHDLMFMSVDLTTVQKEQNFYYRDYKNVNPSRVVDEFNRLDWLSFYETDNPDTLTSIFTHNVRTLYDNCIPLRKIKRVKDKRNPWFTAQIQKSMIDRDRAYKKWKISKNDNDFQTFKRMRNASNTLVTKAKRDFYNRQLNTDLPVRLLWNKLRELGFSTRSLNVENNFTADEINRSFHKHFTSTSNETMQSESRVVDGFKFINIQEYDVINAVYEVSSNAVGLDELPIKFIKFVLPLLLQPITYLFNCIINSSIYPGAWKMSKIIPIKKKNNCSSLDNLRPISILSALSKAFERILKNRFADIFMIIVCFQNASLVIDLAIARKLP